MTATRFKPKAWLKDGCPYSFKFLLFMTEARLLDRIEVIRCDPDSAAFDDVKQRLARATGREATFPTVELEPGRYLSDSDRLIAHFAHAFEVDPDALPALSFYEETLFAQLVALHQ